jgi:Sap, sulfolipid-1-addressing protein
VFGQAASYAILAAISPTALLVMMVYLGSTEPRRTAGLYLAGAVLMSTVMAVVLLIVVRSIGLQLPGHRTLRYDVRLGLGILALAAAAYVARPRKAPPLADQAEPAKKQNRLVSWLISEPSPATAFLAGIVVFVPSLTFIAAVQVVATARERVAVTAAALVVVVVIALAIVWVPLLTYMYQPERTTRSLKALNTWLGLRGRQIAALALAVGGLLLVLNGGLGLAA